jgi:phosphoglycolate phosphatase
MRWQTGIFDWNGTLLNDLQTVIYGSITEIFRTYGLKAPSLDTYRNEICSDFMPFYWKYGIPKTVTGEELNKIRKVYLNAHSREIMLQRGARDLIVTCRRADMQTAIVSGEITEVLEDNLRRFRIIGFFDSVRGDARNKEEALIATLDELGTKAEDAFYVDDTFDGLTSAKNVGLDTIGVTIGYGSIERIKAANPTHIVNSLDELRTMVEEGAEN